LRASGRSRFEIEQLLVGLARVLYHQYVDLVRQRARSPSLELVTDEKSEDTPSMPARNEGRPGRARRTQRQRERILRPWTGLNPEQRAVVAMHDVEGYTLEELEKVLETPLAPQVAPAPARSVCGRCCRWNLFPPASVLRRRRPWKMECRDFVQQLTTCSTGGSTPPAEVDSGTRGALPGVPPPA